MRSREKVKVKTKLAPQLSGKTLAIQCFSLDIMKLWERNLISSRQGETKMFK